MNTVPYKKCSALLETLVNMTESNGVLLVRADLIERITKVWLEVAAAAKVATNSNDRFDQIFKMLEDKMKKIEQLHVFSLPTADLKYFAVDIFPNVEVLKLDLCPPSTVKGIYSMRNVLKTLVITNSGITNMSRSLAPFKKRILRQLSPMIFPDTVFNIPPRYLWSNLLTLKLSNCGISKIDESMHFFPSIEHLDLSHNTISHIIHLHDCIDLKYVNFSFNRIRVLSNLERVIGSVTMINLSHNEVESLDGIDRILSLEKLDVSYNRVNDFAELQALCRLPNLEAVRLEGNPIASAQPSSSHYRMRVFRAFIANGSVMRGDRPFPVLDGVAMTVKERRIFKRVLFRTTTDKEASFSHFDANLLSSTDVLLDQELGGDWGNLEGEGEDGDDSGFGDIYGQNEGGGGAGNFSFSAEDPSSAGVAGRPQSGRSGGVGELGSPETALRGTFSSLGPAPGGGRSARHSVAGGRSSSPLPPGSRMSVGARTMSTVLSPHALASPTGSGGSAFRQSMYGRALSIGGGGDRSSFVGVGAPVGVSSPSKRLALRYIQATNAARAGEASNALRVKRKAEIIGAGAQEVYPDLAEVEAAMKEVRERLRAEALALARAREQELQMQARSSSFVSNANAGANAAMSVSRSHESPLGSFSAGNRVGGSLESRYADQAYDQHRDRAISSRNSDQPEGSETSGSLVPTTTMDELGRRVGTDYTSAAPDERDSGAVAVSAQLRSALDRSLHRDDTTSGQVSPATDRPQRYSFSSDGDASQATSLNSSFNNLGASYSQSFMSTGGDMAAYERTNMLKRAGGINPLAHPRAARGIADVSPGVPEQPAPRMFASLEAAAAAEATADTTRNSFSIRPADLRMSFSSATSGRTYANVAGSPRPSEYRSIQDPRGSIASTPTAGAAAGTGAGSALDAQSYEEVAGPPNTYVGDPDYRNLSVVENMDLYMKEQVFNIKRPSGVNPYMRDGIPSESGSEKLTDLAEGFIQTSNRYEKFITVFCEKVIDITAHTGNGSGGAMPGTPPRMSKGRRDQLPRADEEALAAQEETRYLVLTDTSLYFVRVDFPVQAIFSDAPVPTVVRAHKLYSLSTCMIFFGFQRCILGFVNEAQYRDLIYDALAAQAETTASNSATSTGTPRSEATLPGEKVYHQYMILTREKTRTYPLITRINKAANLQRSSFVPIPLPNVLIDNKDFQLVEQVLHCTLSLGGDHDILHYQMAYQVWRKRPGVKVPRTIILTQSLLMLCSEELNRPEINLDVIDTAALSEVQKIYMDDNPLYVTFVLKSSALFGKTRKWRMCTDSRATSTRLQEECRRACAEKGNTGV